jgi:hypothetical protein
MIYKNHETNENYSKMTMRQLQQVWADLLGKPIGDRYLLSQSVKIAKGSKKGFETGVAYMPANKKFDGGHTCSDEKKAGCGDNCLVYTGHMALPNGVMAREDRFVLFLKDPALFFEILKREILKQERRARKKGFLSAGRMNGTTDLDWTRILFDGRTVFEHFPQTTWYDYTKNPNLARNYLNHGIDVTLSWYKRLDTSVALELLDQGANLAIAYYDRLPEFQVMGDRKVQVIDGDETDLRFLDPRGVIVGLKFKSATMHTEASERNARALESGFIIESNHVIV